MAEDPQAAMLRLLEDIRGEQRDLSSRLDRLEAEMRSDASDLGRRMDGVIFTLNLLAGTYAAKKVPEQRATEGTSPRGTRPGFATAVTTRSASDDIAKAAQLHRPKVTGY